MRTLILFTLAALTACAQPSAFTRLDLYPSGASTGLLRFFEVRSNGSNYAGIRGRSAMASDCEFVISNLSFEPCGDALQTLGDPARRWSHVYSAAATLSGSGNVLQITGSASGSALDISGGGGGRATSFFATTRMIAGGDGYYVTPDGIAQNAVIDNARNITAGDISFNSGSVRNVGSAGTRAAGVYSDALYAYSSGAAAVSIPNATAFNALNIQNGGGAALTWFATNSLNTTGTINVGASIGTLSTVIDNAKNGTFNNVTISGTFRYGTSTTSGNVFTADASGFGTWQALPVASGSVAGVVSTGTQTFAGAKTFSSSATFSNGLSTNSGTDSTIFIGNGNFYIRSFSGAPNCSGVTNGWIGLDTSGGTSGRLYVCNGGNARYVDLN